MAHLGYPQRMRDPPPQPQLPHQLNRECGAQQELASHSHIWGRRYREMGSGVGDKSRTPCGMGEPRTQEPGHEAQRNMPKGALQGPQGSLCDTKLQGTGSGSISQLMAESTQSRGSGRLKGGAGWKETGSRVAPRTSIHTHGSPQPTLGSLDTQI